MPADKNLRTVEKLFGLSLIFMGFINILLSLSGNYPMDRFTAMTFLFGVVLFVHGSAQTWHKWIIIGMAIALAALFLIRGQVDTWTQIGLFYGTLIVAIIYIFFAKEPRLDEDTTHKGTRTGD